MTLHDIGFTHEAAEKIVRLLLKGKSTEKTMEILDDKRNGTLVKIHFKEKQLDCLDYLPFKLKQANHINL